MDLQGTDLRQLKEFQHIWGQNMHAIGKIEKQQLSNLPMVLKQMPQIMSVSSLKMWYMTSSHS